MGDAPRVTIGIPAFRAAPFIERCVRSALESTLDEIEVIVLDDTSDDGTAERAEAIRDSRLRVVRHPENVGRVENVKRALEVGTAPVVALLPADCALTPSSLEVRVTALERHPEATFAFGAVEICDAGDHVIGRRDFGRSVELLDRLVTPGPFLPSNKVFISSCAIRRKSYDAIGGLRIDVAPTHRDWDLLLRLACEGPVAYTPETVAVERVHAGNVTAELERDDRIVTAELLILEAARAWALQRAPEQLPTIEAAMHQWSIRRVAHAFLAMGGFTPSSPARALGCALTLDPRVRRNPLYHAALLASALPEGMVQPVLRPLLAPVDRRRRRRSLDQSSIAAQAAQRSTP